MMMRALAKAKTKAKVAQARTEIAGIAAAINQYYATYSRYPSSKQAVDSLTDKCPDFTFGTIPTYSGGGHIPPLVKAKKRSPYRSFKSEENNRPWQNCKAAIMGILLDGKCFP